MKKISLRKKMENKKKTIFLPKYKKCKNIFKICLLLKRISTGYKHEYIFRKHFIFFLERRIIPKHIFYLKKKCKKKKLFFVHC